MLYTQSNEIDLQNLKCIEDRYARYQEKQRLKLKYIYSINPELKKQAESFNRGLGFNPINDYFKGSTHHHLHVEGNTDFIIYIPTWLHKMYFHNSLNWAGMDAINSISLSYWLIDQDIFNNE